MNAIQAKVVTNLYTTLFILILCAPLQRIFIKIFGIMSFPFVFIAFTWCLGYISRFSVVKTFLQQVLYVIFNNILFQKYLQICLRYENNLCSPHKVMRACFWFALSYLFSSAYFGQVFHKMPLIILIDLLIVLFIILYVRLRFSVLFNTTHEGAVSWQALLDGLSRNLLFEMPLKNKLKSDEHYLFIKPQLSWAAIRNYFFSRTKATPTQGGSPQPPEEGGALSAALALAGVAISPVILTSVEKDNQQKMRDLLAKQHEDNLAQKLQQQAQELAQQTSDRSLQSTKLLLTHEESYLKDKRLQLDALKAQKRRNFEQENELINTIEQIKSNIKHTKTILKSHQDGVWKPKILSEFEAKSASAPNAIPCCKEEQFCLGSFFSVISSLKTFLAHIVI